jgi:hypothetical protein
LRDERASKDPEKVSFAMSQQEVLPHDFPGCALSQAHSLTHQCVDKPLIPKNLPPIREDWEMLILSSPGGRQGLCFCDELNPQFTTGEKHEENRYQDRIDNAAAFGFRRIFRSGRYRTSPDVLSKTLHNTVALPLVSGWFKLATHSYA